MGEETVMAIPISNEDLFLPPDYSTNPTYSRDDTGDAFWEKRVSRLDRAWQVPVYEFAGEWIAHSGATCVVDVGCGPGEKLMTHVAPYAERVVGLDQESGIRHARRDYPQADWRAVDLDDPFGWASTGDVKGDVIICADVIEHLMDPLRFLESLRTLVSETGVIILSTPDRQMLEDAWPSGPPRNQRHIREWRQSEMELLLERCGLRVLEVHHLLPRSYFLSVREVLRRLGRIFTRKPLPDALTCMVLVVCPQHGLGSRTAEE